MPGWPGIPGWPGWPGRFARLSWLSGAGGGRSEPEARNPRRRRQTGKGALRLRLTRRRHHGSSALLDAPNEEPVLVFLFSGHLVERLLGAPARDPYDSPHARVGRAAAEARLEGSTRRRPRGTGRSARRRVSRFSKLRAAAVLIGDPRLLQLLLLQLPGELELRRHLPQDVPLAFLSREGVLVGLPEELLLDEHFDGRGIRSGKFPLVAIDGLHVLIAAKNELLLPLALNRLLPERNRGHEEDAEDDDEDDDAEENVARFARALAVLHSTPPSARS